MICPIHLKDTVMQISTTFKVYLLRTMNQIIDFQNSNLMGCNPSRKYLGKHTLLLASEMYL